MTERNKPRGLTRLLRAFGNSYRGFIGCFREEAAFRQELALAVVVILAGLWFGRTGVERRGVGTGIRRVRQPRRESRR